MSMKQMNSKIASQNTEKPILELKDITKIFSNRGHSTTAAQNVNFKVEPGKIVALVGESGSGKSTLAKLITGIERPTSGSISFGKWAVDSLKSKQLRKYRKHVQMIFQDPFASLNPHNTVLYTIVRPLRKHLGMSKQDARNRAIHIMETVRLTPVDQFMDKKPHQMSGGQRQRLVIARAIACEPDLVVADEPVSMLDVSIRADVLYLIDELRRTQNMSVIYITHDMLSARVLADEVVVLYRGHVVEQGRSDEVIKNPAHPYTQLLFSSIPNPYRHQNIEQVDSSQKFAEFDVPMEIRLIQDRASNSGCPFASRCPFVMDKCLQSVPPLTGNPDHLTACYR